MIADLFVILQSFDPEWVWVLQLIVSFSSILLLLKFFGKTGIYIYIAVAVIGANIQVLKVAQFSFFPEPVALGTILFTSTFLCSDILTEYYGKEAARKGVLIGFSGLLLFIIFMLLTIGFKPLTHDQIGEEMAWAIENHNNIKSLFTPIPGLFIAGMIAYFISQYNDIWIFHFIKKLTHNKFLWLRNNVSTALSTLIDNTIFSLLAWYVFLDPPLDLSTIIVTYIFGTYIIRLIVSITDTPFMYIARYCIPKSDIK